MRIIDFIFYRGERIGQYGKVFKMWKFRTMVHGAANNGPYSVGSDDQRVTRIGKILRRFHIDELPNVINVIKGEMSIIGPRPEVPYYIERMPPTIRRVILSVKPGIIDRASFWDRDEGKRLRGQPDPDGFYERKIWPEKLRLQCESILKIPL